MFTSDQKFSRPSLALKMQIVIFIIHKKTQNSKDDTTDEIASSRSVCSPQRSFG